MTRKAILARRLARLGRKGIALGTALTMAAAVCIVAAVVATTVRHHATPPAPAQRQWGGAAGQPHRVTATAALGRVVDGRVVPAPPAARNVTGPVVQVPAELPKGAVPDLGRPPRLHLPARGTARESTRVLPAPKPAAKAGYNARTSKPLPLAGPDEISYANADGTRTAFEFQSPVNYRNPGGQWATINTTLAPLAGQAGWRQRSAAEPISFARFASSPALVTMPLAGGRVASYGIKGVTRTAGRATGSTVTYAGAAGHSDVSFSAGPGMVQQKIVLRSAAAPAAWVFPLHLTGLRAVAGPGGIIEFTDPAGTVLAYVPPGSMSDSDINPRSGDGATSYGVRYALTGTGGHQAIRMTLDTAWLDSKARVYPVTVDPSVDAVNSDGTTYVLSPYDNDYSGDTEIKVGTWDGGTNTAKSFLKFDNVSSNLKNDTVLGARLGVFNTWSYSCSPRTVYVYPVTSSWSVGGDKSWPGPSTGGVVGEKTFATGWVPLGSTSSPCPASWEGIDLNQAGTNLVDGWTHGSVTNDGLAMGASGSDSYAWKKFASDSATNGDPFLSVTYTTDGARYALGSTTPITPVEPGQNGKFAIKVTNTGASTWTTSNGYELSYRAYNSAGKQVANHPVFTAMPSTVAPGQTVTVDATVDQLAAGSYAIDWDMYSGAPSSPVAFSSQGIPPFAMGLYVPQPPPTVTNVYPPTGYISPTLTPQLSTVASTKSGTITYTFTVTCDPLPGQTCPADVISSGTLTVPYWTIPAAEMQWNTPYQWTVKATVNGSSTTVGPVSLTPEVPQPGITSALGTDSGAAFDPQSGNFTTSATDAAVATAGPPLQIDRTYNSLDPRTSGAFGAGWSSVLDTALRPDSDGSGNVVVTMPDGQEMRFGQNGPGSYAAPFGSPDVLVHNSPGTWTLLDSSGNTYDFTPAGQLTQISDAEGLAETFTDNSSGEVATITRTASGRALALTWSTPSGAAYPHVASVSTGAPASGQSGFTWTYSYTGDDLTQVCAPGGGCTGYGYTTGSHYRAAVLDSGPESYWQLGEASGATSATDEVDANLGTTNGTYSNVTLGAAGPLAGSSETAASFDGTNSSVALPADLMTDGTDVSVGLWFKAASSTAAGVLFSYDADALSNSAGNTDHHEPALYVGGNGELYGELWNGSVDPIHTSASVDDGNWHYAVLTGSSTSQSLYLDGSLVGTLSGQINQMNMTVDTIGAGFWQGGWPNAYITVGPTETKTAIGYFDGDIAQAAVYPRALGAPAVTQQYGLASAASPELTQVTLPSGNVYEQASYDPATGRVAGYTDPNGGQWAISDPIATGYKASATSLGRVIRSVTVTDPAGRSEVYGYDALDGGRLVSYGNGVDTPRTFGYDAAGFLASVTDSDGNLACFTNDIHGNVLTRTWYPVEPASLPGGGTGSVSGCGGSTSSSPTCTTSGSPCTTFYSYYYDASNPLDPRNNELTGVRDARSASATSTTYLTSYAYNAAGQLLSATTPATSDFPSGRTTSYTYTTASTAAYGGGTTPAGLPASATTPGGAVTGYRYYSDGDLAQVTEPTGRSTVYGYDALGRALTSTVTTSSYPAGLTTSYTYNPANQPVTVTDPGVLNQVTGVTHTQQDAYSYDADGNLVTLAQSDMTGGDATRTTSYTYNDHDEVASVTQPAGATSGGSPPPQGASSPYPQGATTSYDYDSFGNVVAMTDPDNDTYRYTYNEYNEDTQVTLYTPSTSQADPTANCSPPATQDPDGGCDLVVAAYSYDPAGLLASATDAMGRITDYTYDTNQDLVAVTSTDASTSPTTGRQVTYSYDGAGNLVSQAVNALSGGAVTTSTVTDYTVDAADRVDSELIDPTPSGTDDSGYLNRTVSYTYNADSDVTAQTMGTVDGSTSSTTDYGYNTAGEMTSQTVLDGSTNQETTWTYDQNGKPLSMTTPAGNVSGGTPANYTTSYGYDQAGDLATVTGPPVATQTYQAQTPVTSRPVTSYGYDTFADQTQQQDPDRHTTTTGYDGDGRVTSVTQPSYTPPGSSTPVTATTSYAYDGDGNLVQSTDPAGHVTSYGYNGLGDLTSVTEPQLPGQSAPGVQTYSYDADGEQLSATDPLDNTTSQTYDYFGNQATATDAMGHTTSYSHDYLGDVTRVATPDGAITTNSYDHLGELTSTANAYGDTTGYTYTYAGQVAQVTNPDTSFAQYGYDPAGNLTGVTDYGAAPAGQGAPQLRSESFGYDPNGDLTSAKNWDGNTTSYSYNAAAELTSQVVPVSASSSDTTSYGYDPAGNQTALTDADGNTTWTTYNTWGLPESVIEPATAQAPAASQRTWTTGYDADGQPASVSQPGGVTQTYAYNPLGDVSSQAGSGAAAPTTTQAFGYDLDGRLTSATAPGGSDSFSYNADSELTGTTGPSGTSGVGYNGDGLISSETDTAGTTSYTYDNADRLATEADPLTGATLSYGYNADSQPTSIGYSVSGAAGPKQALTYGSLGLLASDTLTSSSGSTLASQSYGYNSDGDLTSQDTTGLTRAGDTSYGYNQADELTSATTGGTTTNYGYDADGNLTQAGGTSYAYNQQNQLTTSTASAGTTSYGYTLSGALSSVTPPSGGAQDYTSDAFGQTATAPGGISYGYDALGRLVSRTAGSGTASLGYVGGWDTLASDGTDDYSYTPSGTVTAAQASGGPAYATLSDVHGDLSATFSAASSASGLAGSASYGPYGAGGSTGTMPAVGYQGDYTDPSSGQVDMNARWYSPGTGSFTSNDTAMGSPLPASLDNNPYAYGEGNPLTTEDLDGHGCGWFSFVCDAGSDIAHAYEDIGSAYWHGLNSFWNAESCFLIGCTPAYGPECPSTGCGGGSSYNPASQICYYCHGTPVSHGNSGGSNGGNNGGGCGFWCYPIGIGVGIGVGVVGICAEEPELCVPVTPPPPPPPPQDCFAGPDPGCSPPQAPKSLRDDPYESSKTRSVTNPKDIPGDHTIIEKLPPDTTVPDGTSPTTGDVAGNAAEGQGSGGTPGNLVGQGTGDVGEPATPEAGGPGGNPGTGTPEAGSPEAGAGNGTGAGEGPGGSPVTTPQTPEPPDVNPAEPSPGASSTVSESAPSGESGGSGGSSASSASGSSGSGSSGGLSRTARIGLGAGVGAATSVTSDLVHGERDWVTILAHAGIGAATGTLGGIFEGAKAVIGLSALGGSLNSIGDQLYDNHDQVPDFLAAGVEGGLGAIVGSTGPIAKALGGEEAVQDITSGVASLLSGACDPTNALSGKPIC